MAPTPEQTSAGYHALWARSTVRDKHAAAAKKLAQQILTKKAAYKEVERATGVPWFMIGPIHNRESSLRFNAHLHCGDPLTARTYHVPANRPAKGAPPFTWEDSAIDALTMPPHALSKVKTWSVERILYETEKYNGWGYLRKGNSPYLWSWTSEYTSGKYYADGKYSADIVDKQAGCVAVLKALAYLDPSVAAALNMSEAKAPKEVIDDATKKERAARNAATATGVGSGAGEAANQTTSTTEAPPSVVMSVVAYTALGAAIAAILVVSFLIARKKLFIAEKWG